MISKDLLEILCCPVTKQPLQEENGALITADRKRAYPIKQGVPVLLAEEAVLLN
ncbi:MAG: Trm112 family protein [Fibromonadaceae bacterium]|jgi:uncharacterized protein YbaR (Trm112 family)|nr:Trm112 family protein [Fibromonadaceae bacterium]